MQSLFKFLSVVSPPLENVCKILVLQALCSNEISCWCHFHIHWVNIPLPAQKLLIPWLTCPASRSTRVHSSAGSRNCPCEHPQPVWVNPGFLRCFNTFRAAWFWRFSQKNSSFRLPYQRPSSSADCARELFSSSNGSASLVDCTRKNFFAWGVRFFVSDVISGGLLGHLGPLCLALGANR